MIDPVQQQQLLGHLLGALEEPERQVLDRELAENPDLQQELALVGRQIEVLDAARPVYTPPVGLASRTCEWIFAQAPQPSRLAQAHLPPAVPILPPIEAPAPGWMTRIRWADLAMAIAVFVAATALLFPALQNSRTHARLRACQDHLRQLGLALTEYSQQHDDYFPSVPARGRLAAAGVYAPVLLGSGLLTDSEQVVCPDSPLARQRNFRVPSISEIQMATAEELDRLRRLMGGSYGYCLGYIRDGTYQPTKNLRREHFAVMADAPAVDEPGRQSLNHGRRGQNVLFEDGHVVFLASSKPFDEADDIFANELGAMAAGTHPNDSVIGASTVSPITCASDP